MVPLNRNIRKQILITEVTRDKLKAVSDMKNLSENEIVNTALESYFKRFKNLDTIGGTANDN